MHRTLATLGLLSFTPALWSQMQPSVPAAITIPYEANRDGLLTLVVEGEHESRIKNLVADYPVHKGHNIILWDGSSLDSVALPGRYHVRGLFHQRIVPHLQYSIYSPGNPPWPTADGTGAWLADHTPPASALFLPGGSLWPTHSTEPEILLGAEAAEAGHALMWTDLNGRKLGGIKIRGWNGGIALARDIGDDRNPDHIAYTVYVVNPSRDFGKTNPGALQVFAITKGGLTPLEKVVGGVQTHDAFRELVGLAACNGLLLLSNPAGGEIVAFDVRHNAQAPFAKIKLPHLGAVAFEPDGHLLVATEGAITRFTLHNDWHSLSLADPQVVVPASLLESPKQIIEAEHEIYVTDWGSSHQVKVFSASTGRPLRIIGHPGGPQLGAYDEQRMAHPLGMTIDSNGVLWVAEEDYLPKRISRWDVKTGRFLNAWYGPTQYGGGGFADPHDLYRAYYPSIGNPGSMGLLEFRVDPSTLASPPVRPAQPTIPATGLIPFQDTYSQTFRPARIQLPKVDQFNVAVQQQFGPTTTLDIAYVGNVGERVYPGETYGYDLNEPSLPTTTAQLAAGSASRRPYYNQFVGTYNGVATICCSNSMTSAAPSGHANYNSLQTKLDKRFAHGLQFNANYTWSKAMNYANDAAFNQYKQYSYGRNDTNRSNIFVLSGVYELPFGKDRMFLSHSGHLVNYLVGGYSLTGQTTWESGRPFTPTYAECGADQDLDNNFGGPGTTSDCRPNGDAKAFALNTGALNTTTHARTYFTPVAALTSNGAVSGPFQRPAFGSFGNIGRLSMVGPRDYYADVAVLKDIPITERFKGQFQFQAFNIFNHAALDIPTGSNSRCIDCTVSQGAGVVTALEGNSTMRRLQFAARLTF
ncbi:hypothetical protein [Granulicella arctica]|uniref:TonB-dependent transporter Oar-like beta-barrel domain-containing protein n=1 Tax=Granulicella arctica TaxID=940613 RepID=A0A7Y9PGP2_9BACT|nr:hypothetical protein [Granulicella arctica]NYF79380.1 hypothetical protein [Granulicella arctica]